MEVLKTENLTFTYPGESSPALYDITLSVHAGEFITLCGKSGCGKSTLLRHFKPALSPHGNISGAVSFENKPISSLSLREQSEKIGFVLQSPDNQLVTDKVWHELAFGLESLGLSNDEIRIRVAEMASFFGIQTWFHKNVNELSGGQKQLLNLASVMVMRPHLLILDEPTSQLDPIAAEGFLETVAKINRELGTTVILSEHRLENVFAISDRVIVMENGTIIADDTPQAVGKLLIESENVMMLALPTAMRIYAGVQKSGNCPITVREGRSWLRSVTEKIKPDLSRIHKRSFPPRSGNPLIELKELYFRYEKNLPDIVCGLSAKIYKGEFFTILGGNGTGKTTTLSIINGLLRPYRGKINLEKGLRTSMLPQNPQSLFVKSTVELDLREVLDEKHMHESDKRAALDDVIELCELSQLCSRHPYDLSGGEQQRAALAKLLLQKPDILLLDEPTKGLDAHFKAKLANILNTLKNSGTTIIAVSHDIEFCAEYSDRCAMFFDGSIVSEATPYDFFSNISFYTTKANAIARDILPGAILAEDIIAALGASTKKFAHRPSDTKPLPPGTNGPPAIKTKAPTSKKRIVTALLMLLAIPLTIYAGIVFFGDRKYYFISLLIMLETMLPFFMLFEKRRPQARELVIISVLCAVAISGRAAFFAFPQFKPVLAIIIISGACFGGEAGFLVGAITGFVSNFFFGQGPWTPWQMFAFGIVGLLSGILFGSGTIAKKRLPLCIYGGLSAMLIYGGIMNPSSVIMWQQKINMPMLISSYMTGLPFDGVHAAATIFFLWFISKPMIEKLERIKLKYGLLENM